MNIHDSVKVKLTDHGKALCKSIYEQYADIVDDSEAFSVQEDSNGYSFWIFKNLMFVCNGHLKASSELLFTDIELVEAKPETSEDEYVLLSVGFYDEQYLTSHKTQKEADTHGELRLNEFNNPKFEYYTETVKVIK